jgi:3-methyl-2-oxobutanoate hydroxymethyltransferase
MPGYLVEDQKKVTTRKIRAMKAEGKQIAMLTSYDFTTARIVDQAGVDMILVGDSASNVMAGNETTIPITLDEMIYHARSVVRGVKRALVVCDMPFGSYQITTEDALRNAVRIMKETGVDALKLEGGAEISDSIRKMVTAGIPVCGHLGLTPQSIYKFGGYGVRAKEEAEATKLILDAKVLAEAGCFAIVVEKIPADLTQKVAEAVSVPIIGIGAGSADGQVLVVDDMLGKNEGFRPKFLRVYANIAQVMIDAIGQYVTDVKSGDFPNEQEHY